MNHQPMGTLKMIVIVVICIAIALFTYNRLFDRVITQEEVYTQLITAERKIDTELKNVNTKVGEAVKQLNDEANRLGELVDKFTNERDALRDTSEAAIKETKAEMAQLWEKLAVNEEAGAQRGILITTTRIYPAVIEKEDTYSLTFRVNNMTSSTARLLFKVTFTAEETVGMNSLYTSLKYGTGKLSPRWDPSIYYCKTIEYETPDPITINAFSNKELYFEFSLKYSEGSTRWQAEPSFKLLYR